MTGVRLRRDRRGLSRDAAEPAWKSSNACTSSSRVFMTNGPYAATGSRIGRPPRSRMSSWELGPSGLLPAATVRVSPGPNAASWPIVTGRRSAPTVPEPAST